MEAAALARAARSDSMRRPRHEGRGTRGIAAHPEVPLASLAHEDFIDFCGQWALRDVVEGAFDRAAVVRNGRCEADDVTVGFSRVEAGLGVMIVPEHLAERQAGLARLAIQGDPSWRIGAITPSRAGSALAATIADLLVRPRAVRVPGSRIPGLVEDGRPLAQAPPAATGRRGLRAVDRLHGVTWSGAASSTRPGRRRRSGTARPPAPCW